MKTIKLILLSGIVLMLMAFYQGQKKTTIYMMGDSTMATNPQSRFPRMGWGTAFGEKFNNKATVINKAKDGRSTKSFINEGIWNSVYDNLKAGDWVFIQFGHNDEKVDKPEIGTSIDEYKANLSLFVNKVREKKATPVLLTPIARRRFRDGKLIDTHGKYPEALRKVADSLQVPLIDMTIETSNLLADKGEEESKKYFLILPEGSDNYPNGVTDNTHLNTFGADEVANIVVNKIKELKLPLAAYLK